VAETLAHGWRFKRKPPLDPPGMRHDT
jgi:hypothetical protein